MIGLRTKKEVEYRSLLYEDLIPLLKSAIQSLPLNETNRPMLLEALRLLESLKIAIQAKQE